MMHMTVRKSGDRFFPVKKNGTLWKTGFSSKAKAEAAIKQNKSRLSKLTGRGGGGGGSRRTASNPSPASTSHNSKGMTHHKFMKAFAFGGGAIRQGFGFAETGDPKWITVGLVENYSGFNSVTGKFDIGKASRGYGGPIYLKIEDFILKGAGVAPPSLKRKGFKAKAGLGIYHAAAIANASGGGTPRDKFTRFYHSHFGVKLDEFGMESLDFGKPIMEKVIPYILITKGMQFFGA